MSGFHEDLQRLVDAHAAEIARLTRELEAARALLRELTGHEPVLDDARLRYVEIQVNREAWEAARGASMPRGE